MKPLGFFFVGVAHHVQNIVGAAVQGIGINRRLQAGNCGSPLLLQTVKASNTIFTLCQHLLHFAQMLLGFGQELAVGILLDERPIGVFGALGLCVVAVGFFHLSVMDGRDLQLCFGGFGHVGE